MKKFLLFFLSLLVGLGLLLWVISFIGWEEIKLAFLVFSGWQGVVIVFLTGLMLGTGIYKWKVILKSQGYNLSTQKLIQPYLAGFSLIYLFPMLLLGGEVFRGYFLKEKFSLSQKKALSSVLIDKILEATVFLFIIFIACFYFLFKISLPPKDLGIIIGGILIFFSFLIGFFYFKSFKKESIANFFIKFFNKKFNHQGILEIEEEVFYFFKFKKRALWEGISLTFLRVAITWLRCWVLILFLGKNSGFLPALAILGFYYLALLIPIPTALGSHEVIQIFTFQALGLGASLAPAFTMIQRGAELVLAFLGLVIFFRLGAGLLQTILFRKLESLINNQNNQK